MCKLKQLFEIEDFELWETEIEVFTASGKDYLISREQFENWLRWDDRLNWEYNYSDCAGEHVQELGVMSLTEYWAQDSDTIKSDLYDFIVVKIIGEKAFDIKPALESILENAFSHLNPAQ